MSHSSRLGSVFNLLVLVLLVGIVGSARPSGFAQQVDPNTRGPQLAPASSTPFSDLPPGPSELWRDAESRRLEGSCRVASDLYEELAAFDLPPFETSWLDFRRADCQWRSDSAAPTSDSTPTDDARRRLQDLATTLVTAGTRPPRLWVEVQESLADSYWLNRRWRNWSEGWGHYAAALEWWGGSSDLDEAGRRYLGIVWRAAEPPEEDGPREVYGYWGNMLPVQVLDAAQRIARSAEDRAHADYLIAMTLRYQGGDWRQRQRVAAAFRAAVDDERASDWYDDALYHYGEWLASYGRPVLDVPGQWQQETDFVEALTLFRRLVSEFDEGESRYWRQSQNWIETITTESVGLVVSNVFLPDSGIEFHLNWRNVETVDFELRRVDLTADLSFGSDDSSGQWLEAIDEAGLDVVKTWIQTTGDDGRHIPAQQNVRVDDRLDEGAYLLLARAGDHQARELIVVSRAVVVVKSSAGRALVYAADVATGAPLAAARAVAWQRSYRDGQWRWSRYEGTTDDDGLVDLGLADDRRHGELFVALRSDRGQSFVTTTSYGRSTASDGWKIFAFTDRPAYRPGDEVRYKLIARRTTATGYSTPSGTRLELRVHDPQNNQITSRTVTLNAFGSAWESVQSEAGAALGEYRLTVDAVDGQTLASATLFRLEEYKLPEFAVTVEIAATDGVEGTAFRLGDLVEVTVTAAYYFGGPVAGASAEVLVYQRPFYPSWHPPRPYPWLYDSASRSPSAYGPGQIVRRETLTTQADGRAQLRLETPLAGDQDLEYRIEARVIDASRREVVGQGTARVTRQSYYVYPWPRHQLYRPRDRVEIDIRALDANGQPVPVLGRVEVTRDYWWEVWRDPSGREVEGQALRRLRARSRVFPPVPSPGRSAWQLVFRGYRHESILERTLRTDEEGSAELSFDAEREGYYRIQWHSEDRPYDGADDGPSITAETTVWVGSTASTDIGYHYGGVRIVVDRDTFRAGDVAPVMITADSSDAYVLFAVEAEEVLSYRLLHLDGSVKFLELPIETGYVPNVYLSATMVREGQLFTHEQEVVIPPLDHFLEVDVTTDREDVRPGEEGTLTVRTTDLEGRPVSAEVAVAVVDEAVFAIQTDYAGDPREFYFGDKRRLHVSTRSSLHELPVLRLVEGADGRLEAEPWALESDDGSPDASGSDVRRQVGVARMRAASKSVAADAMIAEEAVAVPAASPSPSAPDAESALVVRSDFRSTALWAPDVRTDDSGLARVSVRYPDSLTTWRTTARAATSGDRFGSGAASTRTNQPLMVRLQAPRFFVVGDEVTVSAVINNRSEGPLRVRAALEIDGGLLGLSVRAAGVAGQSELAVGPLAIEAGAELRVDWRLRVAAAGDVMLRTSVLAEGPSGLSDAMERSLPIVEHGIEKFLATAAVLRDGDTVRTTIRLPAERRAGTSRLTVQVSPSLAVTMLDALPYLIDYPYGCTEQTLSRFLPAAIVAKTLGDLGLDPAQAMSRVFGGLERDHLARTQPQGRQDLRRLDEMIERGLARLYDFQHADGGWGWWKDGDSDPFMTAYVLWGLGLARDANRPVRPRAMARAAEFLDRRLVEAESDVDLQVWMLHALAVYRARSGAAPPTDGPMASAMAGLWRQRERLSAYGRALFALSAHHLGARERARVLIRNLEDGVRIDHDPGASVVARSSGSAQPATAHWGETGGWWRWRDGAVETTAFALRAMLAVDPDNALIAPATRWLIQNRRGAQWSNTRDTAIVVLALDDYLGRSGELEADLVYRLTVNGVEVAQRQLTGTDVLSSPSRFVIPEEDLENGDNEIRLQRVSGTGTLYLSAEAEFFSLEEPVQAAGQGLFVERRYDRRVGRPTLLQGWIYDEVPVRDQDRVSSGDRIEVVIQIEAKNDYEYLVMEDLKPAGFEAVELRSGTPMFARELRAGAAGLDDSAEVGAEQRYTGRRRWIYQELRDRKVALFVDNLPQGRWEIRYALRAETPGRFHALPVLGHAMYVPEIRTNGTEVVVTVVDPEDPGAGEAPDA